MSVGFAPKTLLRVAVVMAIASATGACSTLESLNPFGDDDTPAATASDDTAAAPADQTADNGTATPDLADVPDRPAQTTTPDSQKQVSQSLASDRSRAKYSADTLRGGTDTAAPPPAPPSAADTAADDDTSSSSAAPPPAATADASSPPDAAPSSDDSSAPAPVATADNTPPPPVPNTQVASVSAAPPSAAPGDGQPAVPPGPMAGVPGAQAPVMNDSQLGFQPSQAPPLDASVSQFVAPTILNRYRQTSSGNVALASNAVPNSASPVSRSRHSRRGMGGPEEMSGSVVANLDSLSGAPAVSAAPVYAGPNGSPSSVVFFSGDTTILSASAKAEVRAAAASYKAAGATGFVRVVGHASSRTGNMPLERHLVVIFEKSQQRANSVAQELIRDGVPAEKVLVEAVGDSQPVYYESMPKGEDGNRRAEIFLQS